MISRLNGSQWGIKDTKVSFASEIQHIIDNATQFIVICGYNFSPYNSSLSVISRLVLSKKKGVKILFISPPDMFAFGKKNHAGNIQYLVSNGVGVLLNSNNHSKWILSDVGYYYGSLNFTAASMFKKVEVVSYCDKSQHGNASIPQWMSETRDEFLDFVIKEAAIFNHSVKTVNLGAINGTIVSILKSVLTKILKYNPSIQKIEVTLSNYEDVRLEMSTIIDMLFPLLSFEELNLYWGYVNISISILDEIAILGNDIWINAQSDSFNEIDFENYNLLHAKFVSSIQSILNLFEPNRNNLFVQQRLQGIMQEIEYTLIRFKNSEGG